MSGCFGCKLANGEIETYVVYEDHYVTCILDIDPFHDGHTLILPKSHAFKFEDLDTETLKAVYDASILISNALTTVYSAEGISMCHNDGKVNDLGHYHLHVIPRYEGNGIYIGDEVGDRIPEADMIEVRDRIREEIGYVI